MCEIVGGRDKLLSARTCGPAEKEILQTRGDWDSMRRMSSPQVAHTYPGRARTVRPQADTAFLGKILQGLEPQGWLDVES
jgi:hypothetical protein